MIKHFCSEAFNVYFKLLAVLSLFLVPILAGQRKLVPAYEIVLLGKTVSL